jgi:DNA-binding MarR family transcriptional regulator
MVCADRGTKNASMADQIDIREVSGCTCLRARRTTRQLTQIYDTSLKPAGLTVSQFGLLAKLYGASLAGRRSLSIGTLAERLGMDPTTLNRNLKPLVAQGLVADRVDAEDRRVRAVLITAKGRAKLRKAVPFWRRAQARIQEALGVEATLALGDLLDLASSKLAK